MYHSIFHILSTDEPNVLRIQALSGELNFTLQVKPLHMDEALIDLLTVAPALMKLTTDPRGVRYFLDKYRGFITPDISERFR